MEKSILLTVVNTKFLLADDDADDATLFCMTLCEITPTMKCYKAENGQDLFNFLAEHHPNKPDYIFLDINMPIMNGWECLRRLKEHAEYQAIPAVMYSTSSARTDVQKAIQLGAQLFLTKPEDLRELRHILEIMATTSHDSLVKNLAGFKSVRFN